MSILSCIIASGCAVRLYEAAPNIAVLASQEPWLVHCETTVSRPPDSRPYSGLGGEKWLVANDISAVEIHMSGKVEDGFFRFGELVQGNLGYRDASDRVSIADLRAACLTTISQTRNGKTNELLAVRAFRKSDGANLAIDFGTQKNNTGIRKLVVFSDSLSDSGKLKARMHVLPGTPYWAGRFSNGPNWIDYLEAWGGVPVQNHSYGGASVTGAENISRQNLYALIHDGGQYFVSGSIDHQIDDYQNLFLLNKKLQHPEETVFLVWTGSNDYISKEPFSGAIDTLLNHPLQEGGYQTVVDAVIEATHRQLERLYVLGARYVLIANLPDLGNTPIVLQNQSYSSSTSVMTDGKRRVSLASRLSELSRYHNDALAEIVARFRRERPDVHILEFDADQAFSALLRNELPELKAGRIFRPGFSLEAQGKRIGNTRPNQMFQERCYQGGYFGSSIPGKICNDVDKVIFWDVIHPTTYAHCWTAYLFGRQMSEAGWMESPPPPEQYKAWCQGISQLMLGHGQIEDILAPARF